MASGNACSANLSLPTGAHGGFWNSRALYDLTSAMIAELRFMGMF